MNETTEKEFAGSGIEGAKDLEDTSPQSPVPDPESPVPSPQVITGEDVLKTLRAQGIQI